MSWRIVSEPFMNVEKIFPTQQRDVKVIIDTLSVFSEVESITIFGSSVTCLCNPWSDIDVYIECPVGFRRPAIKAEAPLDVWTTEMVDEYLLKEIKEKGVVVYSNY